MDKAVCFFPTERLKITMEQKGITSYIPEDGRDPNPCWDTVSRALWPSTIDNITNRESLAHQLMYGAYDEVVSGACPEAAVIMSRMAQNLMGNTWMQTWLFNNDGVLRRRIKIHKHQYGTGSNFKMQVWFKKLFRN